MHDHIDLVAGINSRGASGQRAGSRRFAVITVPASVGFTAIEDAVQGALRAANLGWADGNVYDGNGAPLDWWKQGQASR